MNRKVRLLIADDARVIRDSLKAYIAHDGRCEVVGEAVDGEDVITKAKELLPDVITMDIQMPKKSGLEAISALMGGEHAVPIVVVAALEARDVDLSVKAMALGALEVIRKPGTEGPNDFRRFGKEVADAAVLMAEVPVVTRRRLRARPTAVGEGLNLHTVDAIGLVASTGGPPALAAILATLPKTLPVPVFIAQHIAKGFTTGLARWFREMCALPVEISQTGMRAAGGRVYLAPDASDHWVDMHERLQVAPNDHGPSGDRLLRSLSEVYRDRACGVVLTGMGADGAAGLLDIRRLGGITFAQDEASSVVYGMPQAAVKMGAAQSSLPLERVGPTLVKLFG
jgi:two-component system chemotaxis response regulator CheB